MAGEEYQFSRMTPEQRAECGRKGGIASGEKRRKKREMKERLGLLLNMPLKNGKQVDIEDVKSYAALKGKNITVEDAILIAQIQRAMKGDLMAATFIRDTSGNKPVDAVSVNGNVNNPFEGLTTEELKRMIGDD